MRANADIKETVTRINDAVAIFEDLTIFMEAKWEDIIRRMAKEDLAKAWLPSTKAHWRKRLASEDIIKVAGSYYNCPNFYSWTKATLKSLEAMKRRYAFAKTPLRSSEIILDNDELDLLSHAVTAAKQIFAGQKGL